MSPAVEMAVHHTLLEYAELFLLLLMTMAYINTMEERLAFETLRVKLVDADSSLFWEPRRRLLSVITNFWFSKENQFCSFSLLSYSRKWLDFVAIFFNRNHQSSTIAQRLK